MKIVKIYGGLGNQMFQCAFIEALKRKHPQEKIKMDVSWFSFSNLREPEVLKIFSLPADFASFEEISKLGRKFRNHFLDRVCNKFLPPKKTEIVEPLDDRFNQDYLDRTGNVYYKGYWQNYRYFESFRDEIVKHIFVFPDFMPDDLKNKDAVERMCSHNSVAVHVRRGDYLKYKMYCGICDEEYYRKCLRYIQEHVESPHFYIFSNDIPWCKEFFLSLLQENQLTYIDWNIGSNSFRDMHLMSECRHMILANSSFSWWAAYLTKKECREQIILSPKRWINGPQAQQIHYPTWIKI